MRIKTLNFIPEHKDRVYKELCRKIQQDIANGYLKKGDQLPSIRMAANLLQISRTTVEHAYQQLCLEGYLLSIPQKGYFILIQQEDAQERSALLSANNLPEELEVLYDFSSDSIDPEVFDAASWKHYIKTILMDDKKIYSYGDVQGEPALRNALQRYAYTMRGVLCTPDQILIGAGFQSLLSYLCSMMERPQIVAMEACGFTKAEQVFSDHNFNVIKIPMQQEGISIDCLKQYHVTMLYLNSAAVGMTKKPLQTKQRQELLTWAAESNVLIIEDDHNGELRYLSKSMPALQGMGNENVIYIGSFSKLLLPSIRIGYMVLNQKYLTLYQKRRNNSSPSVSKIEQLALGHYIRDGHLERQIRRSKKRYEYRARMFLELCRTIFPSWNILVEETALRIRLQPPKNIDLNIFLVLLQQHRIRIQIEGGDLLLSFSSISLTCLKDVLSDIKELWEEGSEYGIMKT